MTDKVFIIIVNYNGFIDTIGCVESLKRIDYSSYEIVIVDNCSTDNSYEKLSVEYADSKLVSVIKTNENNGFSYGNNVGLRYAISKGGNYFLLLNNDTEVELDFLTVMMSKLSNSTVVCPLIYYYDDKTQVWYGAGYINKLKCIVENGDYKKDSYVDFATGCCMLFNRKVLDDVGFLPEEFFMYYEDVEYSLCLAEKGFKILYTPEAVVYHKAGKSSGGENSKLAVYYNNRNRFFLIRKHHLGIGCVLYSAITRIARWVVSCFTDSNDRIIYRAYKDFTGGIMGKADNL